MLKDLETKFTPEKRHSLPEIIDISDNDEDEILGSDHGALPQIGNMPSFPNAEEEPPAI